MQLCAGAPVGISGEKFLVSAFTISSVMQKLEFKTGKGLEGFVGVVAWRIC